MMKAIVHIGTPKTGTTAAQVRFSGGREALLEAGIFYPETLGAQHHLKLATACRSASRPERGFKLFNIRNEKDHANFREQLRKEFAAELEAAKKAGAHTCLISSEWLYGRLTKTEEIDEMRRFLAPFFEDVLVIVWLRPQVEFLLSLASTLCRNGDPVTEKKLKSMITSNETFYYDQMMKLWEGVFGKDGVKVFPYTRKPDVVATIFELIGATAALPDTGERINSKLGVRLMAMANQIRVPHANHARDSGWDRRQYFQKIDSPEDLKIDLKVAREIQSVFEAGNKALIGRHAELSGKDLDPDWSRFGSSSNIALLDQDCAFSSELTQLIGMMENDLKIQRALTEMALAEVDMLKSSQGEAKKHLNTARKLLEAAETETYIAGHLESAHQRLSRLTEKSLKPVA